MTSCKEVWDGLGEVGEGSLWETSTGGVQKKSKFVCRYYSKVRVMIR